jgi:type I restriction enzyme S subunit
MAILDEAFEGIDQAIRNTEKNLANARELFDSYLNKIFTQKGDGWEETTLGQQIDLQTGFPFKSKNYTDYSDDIKLLRGDNIIQGNFRWEDVKRWPKSEQNKYKDYEVLQGDIVLAMDRPWVKA